MHKEKVYKKNLYNNGCNKKFSIPNKYIIYNFKHFFEIINQEIKKKEHLY